MIDSQTYHIDAHKIHIGLRVESERRYRIKVNKPQKAVRLVHISRWQSMKSRARRKGIEATLTPEDILIIINQPCIYCLSTENLSELDRKDSNLGYTLSNVAPACRRCNTIKNNVATYDEMMFIASYLGWRK